VPRQVKYIETLKQDPDTLEKMGWYLVIFYKARHKITCSQARKKAVKAASEQAHNAGIRKFTYNDVTFYEVWSRKEKVTLPTRNTENVSTELTV